MWLHLNTAVERKKKQQKPHVYLNMENSQHRLLHVLLDVFYPSHHLKKKGKKLVQK